MIGKTNALSSSASGGVPLTLLWTNSAPTSNFAAQTVQLSLTNYDAILVKCRATTSAGQYFSNYCFKDETVNAVISSKSYNGTNVYSRGVQCTDTGVTFTTGYSGSSSGAGNAIPVKIYGLTID